MAPRGRSGSDHCPKFFQISSTVNFYHSHLFELLGYCCYGSDTWRLDMSRHVLCIDGQGVIIPLLGLRTVLKCVLSVALPQMEEAVEYVP